MTMSRRGKQEAGAELVEFSLVMIPMFGILFLVIDLSWMLFARAT
jgi:Flp pilus assembly protein TadG